MIYSLIVRSQAEKDIWESALYYEDQVKGLGREFVFCIDDAMTQIQKTPFIYSKIHKEFRRGLVRKFPYGIFYIAEENCLSVVRVLNLRQSPETIRAGLK